MKQVLVQKELYFGEIQECLKFSKIEPNQQTKTHNCRKNSVRGY
jgi:hypothetical protein